MKITDVFRLLIKLFSLFFLASTIFTVILPLTVTITAGNQLFYLIALIVQIVVMISIFWILFFKTDWLLRLFKLDQGFENDRIEFKDSKIEPVLDLAFVIIGGSVIVKCFPIFLSNLFYAFQTSSGINDVTESYRTDMKVRIVTNLLGMVIGYLLITNRRKLIQWLKLDKNEE